MRRLPRVLISFLFFIVPVLFTSCQKPYEFDLPDFPGSRWYKGNTHTHTFFSDGDSSPEQVTKWYKDHGYQFLVISDHNLLTVSEKADQLTDSTFILITGDELTINFEKHPVHINALNISKELKPLTDTTLVGTIQKNVDLVNQSGGLAHVNHPNFRWALNYEALSKTNNYKLLEIYSGHPIVNDFGGGGYPSVEQMWDMLLSDGKRIYGMAVDDAHQFKGEFAPHRVNPGRGWVMVRAASLNGDNIVKSLDAGAFYSSTGVVLDDIIIDAKQIKIKIHQHSDFKYRTEFIGDGGQVLAESEEINPVYTLNKAQKYVRAKVYDSMGAVAWVQPVFIKKELNQ